MLAYKAEALHASGRLGAAREVADKALEAARDKSWFVRYDGAQRRLAIGALRALDPATAITRARQEFGEDLASGNLNPFFLESELTGLFEFLEFPWPRDELLDTIEEYLDEVEKAIAPVGRYEALDLNGQDMGADEALCRFLVTLFSVPSIEIASGARRAFASYLLKGNCSFISKLVNDNCWSDIELECILIALDVASRKRSKVLDKSVRESVQTLNRHESLGVRSVARRICGGAGWKWEEVRDKPRAPRVYAGSRLGGWSQDGSDRLVGGDIVAAWTLYKQDVRVLSKEGVSMEDLESEFETWYTRMSRRYRWKGMHRRGSWAASAWASPYLLPRALVGRMAAMRLLGRYALEGDGPEQMEEMYDLQSPLYDPALELLNASQRPSELRALDWKYMDEREEAWKAGVGGDDWDSYPDRIGDHKIVGEFSCLTRPERDIYCETRIRGVLSYEPDDVEFLAFGCDLTHELSRLGFGMRPGKLIGYNAQGLLRPTRYRWLALNVKVARQLGWRPSVSDPFGWIGAKGEIKVRSIYWRDGGIGVRELGADVVGEGWCLLASDSAVEELRNVVPGANVHLFVERECGRMVPPKRSWHLKRPL